MGLISQQAVSGNSRFSTKLRTFPHRPARCRTDADLAWQFHELLDSNLSSMSKIAVFHPPEARNLQSRPYAGSN
jgi:hypothetical protein